MPIRLILLALVALSALVFTPLNWEVLSRAETVNLVLTRVQAPVGLVLVMTLLAVCLVYFLIAQFSESLALRQLVARDKQIKSLRERLETRRDEALLELEDRLAVRLAGSIDERAAALAERIAVLRNELAADIAATEQSLLSRLGEDESEASGEERHGQGRTAARRLGLARRDATT